MSRDNSVGETTREDEDDYGYDYQPGPGIKPGTLTLGQKLDQRRFTAMSGKMAAVVSYILGDESVMTTDPEIAELIITSDGCVLARHTGEISANTLIGSVLDLTANLARLMVAAGLTFPEGQHFNSLYQQRVRKA
jgi:hypothetical protein